MRRSIVHDLAITDLDGRDRASGHANSPKRLVGRILSRSYRIEEILGQGGMGVVFKARHIRTGGYLAIKMLLDGYEQEPDVLRRFADEARALSTLNHPHIVQVHDLDQDDQGRTFIVMELLDGESLEQRLARRGKLSLSETLAIAREAGMGLHAAHRRGIVHRDVKPGNIFLASADLTNGEADVVKLVDFGISKIRRTERLTKSRTIIGTPFYMSPEQVAGHADELDGRADQFALAVVLYEALTGRRPFPQEETPALFFAIMHMEPPPIGKLVEGIPTAFSAAIRRAMSKRAADRYPSMRDFVQALLAASSMDDDPDECSGSRLILTQADLVTAPHFIDPSTEQTTRLPDLGPAITMAPIRLRAPIPIPIPGAVPIPAALAALAVPSACLRVEETRRYAAPKIKHEQTASWQRFALTFLIAVALTLLSMWQILLNFGK